MTAIASSSTSSKTAATHLPAPPLVKRTSSKRARDEAEEEGTSSSKENKGKPGQAAPAKQTKLASIFTSTSAAKGKATEVDASSVLGEHTFTWLKSNPNLLLHGLYGPPVYSPKLACFDIDGTLIKTKRGRTFPTSAEDWVFWCNKGTVQERLGEYHLRGYSIIFVSNQCYAPTHKPHIFFKAKLPLIAKTLTDVPFRVFAATSKDNNFRKPDIGIWRLLESLYAEQGIVLDKNKSFYVGDAAGRKIDHSSCDIGWANNVGIEFYTPEHFFWEKQDLVRQAVENDGEASSKEMDTAILSPKQQEKDTPKTATTISQVIVLD